MKKSLYILGIFFTLKCFAQAPPPSAHPTEQNKMLIDKLVEIVDFENYINNYCIYRINLAARLEKWDDNKKNQIIKSIHLEVIDNLFYNSFSNYKSDELQLLIDTFSKIDTKRKGVVVPMPLILNIRMEGFSKSVIKGDYLYLNNKK
ncbi:MAG: hypothetical protein H7195_05200 [Chryseobacterium sp.]|nr:hypothetical protein [Chryseobacterium sp.]